MAILFKYVVVLVLCYAAWYVIWKVNPVRYEHISEETISSVAHRDLTVVGHYDDKMVNSLTFLLNEFYQKLLYNADVSMNDAEAALLMWNERKNYDPERKIESCITDVHIKLQKMFDEERERHETFGVDEDVVTYTVDVNDCSLAYPSSVLRCNDHLDMPYFYELYKVLFTRGYQGVTELDMG